MNPIEIPTLDDDRVYVAFRLPVKGGKPIEFRMPRADFIPAEDVKVLTWLIAELEHDEELLASDEPGKFEKAAILLTIRPFVTDDQYEVLSGLTLGQLKFIRDHWQAQSRVTLGE